MKLLSRLVLVVALAGWTGTLPTQGEQPKEAKKEAAVAKPATAEQLAFFEKHIRPVLVRECYSCYAAGAEKVRGGLKLDSRGRVHVLDTEYHRVQRIAL